MTHTIESLTFGQKVQWTNLLKTTHHDDSIVRSNRSHAHHAIPIHYEVSKMRTSLEWVGKLWSSLTMTRAPSFSWPYWGFHFIRSWISYIYSFAHRCQRCWIRLCIFRQRMRRLSLISRTASSGVATSDLPPKKWAKDNGAKLFGSDDSGVKGLKFSIASASARTVANSSKVSLLLAKTRFRWCLKLFSHASSKPLKCGERRYKMLRLLKRTFYNLKNCNY